MQESNQEVSQELGKGGGQDMQGMAEHAVEQEVSQVVGRQAGEGVGQEAGRVAGEEVGHVLGQETGQQTGEGMTREAAQTAGGEGALGSVLKPEDRPSEGVSTSGTGERSPHVEPGMEVTDAEGHKVGSINHVYHQPAAAVASAGDSGLPHEDIFEVKTGFLGLGRHYFVPSSAIGDVTSGRVHLTQPRDRFSQHGWDTRPNLSSLG